MHFFTEIEIKELLLLFLIILVCSRAELRRSWTIIFGVLKRSYNSLNARYDEILLSHSSPFSQELASVWDPTGRISKFGML